MKVDLAPEEKLAIAKLKKWADPGAVGHPGHRMVKIWPVGVQLALDIMIAMDLLDLLLKKEETECPPQRPRLSEFSTCRITRITVRFVALGWCLISSREMADDANLRIM